MSKHSPSKRSPLTFDLGQPTAPLKPANMPTGLRENSETIPARPASAESLMQAPGKKPKVGRAGRQFVAAHVLPEAAKQFKLLAVQKDRTTQELLMEAINDLFAKYGLSRIADE